MSRGRRFWPWRLGWLRRGKPGFNARIQIRCGNQPLSRLGRREHASDYLAPFVERHPQDDSVAKFRQGSVICANPIIQIDACPANRTRAVVLMHKAIHIRVGSRVSGEANRSQNRSKRGNDDYKIELLAVQHLFQNLQAFDLGSQLLIAFFAAKRLKCVRNF